MKPIYLDHAAATPLDSRVLEVMQPFFAAHYHNPSALYTAAVEVRGALENARRLSASYLGVRPAEIIFTAGGSESNNLAISGVMRCHPEARMVTTAIEHDSVRETAAQYEHALIGVDGQGIVDMAALESAIDDRTVLVSVMYANNEIGTIQPIREIGQLAERIRRDRQQRGVKAPLYLHSDAAQAANYLDLQAARLGVDLMTVNGGKLYGPKQSGILYIRGGQQLKPLVYGGGQEHGLRSGTENVAGAVGFAEALQIAQNCRHEESKRLTGLQKHFFQKLIEVIPEAVVNGSVRKRLPNNLHITLPGQDNERLLFQLDSAGIMAAAGSACSASSDTPSHVLQAIGLSPAAAQASLRLTMGRSTTIGELDRTLDVLANLVRGR